MNRTIGISARMAAGIALCVAISISSSCFYFDPRNPFERGGAPFVHMPISWEKYFSCGDYAIGFSVQQTADGGYIIAGYTGTYGGSEQLLLIKTDGNGTQEWRRTFGGDGQHRGGRLHGRRRL